MSTPILYTHRLRRMWNLCKCCGKWSTDCQCHRTPHTDCKVHERDEAQRACTVEDGMFRGDYAKGNR